jgi:hypothetical protein
MIAGMLSRRYTLRVGNTEGSQLSDNCRLAWLAGIIDGEGCFTIFRHHRGLDRAGQRYEHTSASITITNSCAALMDTARGILDGLGVKYKYLMPRNSYTRPIWRIDVRNYAAILTLLDAVDPYLVGKAEQAALTREFCERAAIRKGFADREERAAYGLRMSHLNKHGQLIL